MQQGWTLRTAALHAYASPQASVFKIQNYSSKTGTQFSISMLHQGSDGHQHCPHRVLMWHSSMEAYGHGGMRPWDRGSHTFVTRAVGVVAAGSFMDDDGQRSQLGRRHAILAPPHERIAQAAGQAANALPAAAAAEAAAPVSTSAMSQRLPYAIMRGLAALQPISTL